MVKHLETLVILNGRKIGQINGHHTPADANLLLDRHAKYSYGYLFSEDAAQATQALDHLLLAELGLSGERLVVPRFMPGEGALGLGKAYVFGTTAAEEEKAREFAHQIAANLTGQDDAEEPNKLIKFIDKGQDLLELLVASDGTILAPKGVWSDVKVVATSFSPDNNILIHVQRGDGPEDVLKHEAYEIENTNRTELS